ncbi:MAG: UvrB/UvrC motif-containing protein [Clostridia bacterium]
MNIDLNKKVKKLTPSPGIYLMKDSYNNIIYVGKAKNLKKRVQSYFQDSRNHSHKVQKLIEHIADFGCIETDTEFEAFMLECKMIKDIKPIYNRKMKSPLSYSYIRLTKDPIYPHIDLVNTPDDRDGNRYWGPYSNKNTVEKALQGIKEYYRIPCSYIVKRKTPCLNYSLGTCIGMCLGGPAAASYRSIMEEIAALLDHTDSTMLEEMRRTMIHASEALDFETAARYRDYIHAIHSLLNREKVIRFTRNSHNIVLMDRVGPGTVKLFLIRRCKILFKEKYILDEMDINKLGSRIRAHVMDCFRDNMDPSPLTMKKDEIDEAQIIYGYLTLHPDHHILIPQQWLACQETAKIDRVLKALLQDMNRAFAHN